ncbi:hypothetical protein WN944_026076 [Citrus x changshan-huyou]|uniref:Uncharacterized protein n=1 Tax=Citrus x changshan-huyou TaxID=2935761 RepID=A0AAP0QC24_9ROSI
MGSIPLPESCPPDIAALPPHSHQSSSQCEKPPVRELWRSSPLSVGNISIRVSLSLRCRKGHTAVTPPPGEQVEVEVGVEGDQRIQNLQPSPTEDLV